MALGRRNVARRPALTASLRRSLATLHAADLAAYRRGTERPAPRVDRVLHPLSRAADHSKIWIALAVMLASRGGRANRRAALRGVLSVAATSVLTNAVMKPMTSRVRPTPVPDGWMTRVARVPSSTSFPSGHAASAGAFAVGASLEMPQLAGPLGLAAAAVGWSRVRTRVHYPGDVVAGLVVGAAVAVATTRWWPRRPAAPASVRPMRARVAGAATDGAGLTIVVNPSAGSAHRGDLTTSLREALPAATISVLDEGADLTEALTRVGMRGAIGIVGGDGSINAAAGVALAASRPLAVFPGGTLNHFARDLGLENIDDAVDAVRAGSLGAVDVGLIDGRPFLNTASFGAYASLVDLRERYEDRIGKWPAMAFALAAILRRAQPVAVTVNGTRHSIWLIFIGNAEYGPPGLVPIWRESLDDGLFDVRWVEDIGPFSRVRLIAATLCGQLGRSRTYHRELVSSMTVESHCGPLRLACDGETFENMVTFTVEKSSTRLAVFVPPMGA